MPGSVDDLPIKGTLLIRCYPQFVIRRDERTDDMVVVAKGQQHVIRNRASNDITLQKYIRNASELFFPPRQRVTHSMQLVLDRVTSGASFNDRHTSIIQARMV